jgi:putative endonuclease
MEGAIRREKLLKKWKRVWKFKLIEKLNLAWDDRYQSLL